MKKMIFSVFLVLVAFISTTPASAAKEADFQLVPLGVTCWAADPNCVFTVGLKNMDGSYASGQFMWRHELDNQKKTKWELDDENYHIPFSKDQFGGHVVTVSYRIDNKVFKQTFEFEHKPGIEISLDELFCWETGIECYLTFRVRSLEGSPLENIGWAYDLDSEGVTPWESGNTFYTVWIENQQGDHTITMLVKTNGMIEEETFSFFIP